VTENAKESGRNGDHERLYAEVEVQQAGYLYIYLSNDNYELEGEQVDVFFDDFQIQQVHSKVVQSDDYYPFGLTFNSYSRENTTPQDFKYNGKELQDELNLNWLDYGARMYDPAIARWMAVDPLTEAARRWSPYQYCYNNPIRFIDPDGMFSTEVVDNGDGTYKVVGGNLEDGDKGIYVVKKNEETGETERTGEKIGESLTMYSFYNADEQDGADQTGWKGTIDTNSTESRDLVENFFKCEAENISLPEYMANATDGKKYDFKRNGDPDNNDRENHHRGSVWEERVDGTKVYATARDAGNYSAGYIAGLKGLPYAAARAGFDGLELVKSGHTEGLQSTLAQKAGHADGAKEYKKYVIRSGYPRR
jgi:RHS repeat-associated protein